MQRLFHCEGDLGDVTGISIDTRTLKPGDLFVALDTRAEGGRDGHEFIDRAYAAGAAAIMVNQEQAPKTLPQLQVHDTSEGLRQLGRAGRQRLAGRTIAITGSSGKTTLRAWLEMILASIGPTHASVGSYNNHWGVPLSLARMSADSDYGVFEVGTNHPGEISPLSRQVAPDIAVLLNVLPAHIGNFPSFGALVQEKLSIADGLRSGGTLVLPIGLADQAPAGVKLVTFGPNTGARRGNVDPGNGDSRSVHGGNAKSGVEVAGQVTGSITPEGDGARVLASVEGESIELQIPFHGEHRLQSVLATLAVLRSLDIDPKAVSQLFNELPLPDGRGRAEVINGITLIDDSYNANPVSMQHALDSLMAARVAGRRLALLGEMQELGEAGARAHLDVAASCRSLDGVYAFGDGFAGVAFGACLQGHWDHVDQFDLAAFCRTLRPGDWLLVKGSNQVFWVNVFVNRLREVLHESA